MLLWCRGVKLQQFVQGFGSGLMESGPQGALDGLQIVHALFCRWAKMRHNN